jgi:glutamyl-tRNA reductase
MSAVPLAVVGASYREAPTSLRAKLDAAVRETHVLEQLRNYEAVRGYVTLCTCSRVEWIFSSVKPHWARDLFVAALAKLGLPPQRLHVKTGAAALNYLVDVTLGLDSVSEGEPAVARQVIKAFQSGHAAGTTDAGLRHLWKRLEVAVHERRLALPELGGRGIQSLVIDRIRADAPAAQNVVVWGQGEIGRAVARACERAGLSCLAFTRASAQDFAVAVLAADVVIVCTGAEEPYLSLPPTSRPGLCIDIGSPPQIAAAPGWRWLTLDEILGAAGDPMAPAERAALEKIAAQCCERVQRQLERKAATAAYKDMVEIRLSFFEKVLPELLSGLPRQRSLAIRKAVARFAHDLMVANETSIGRPP